MKTTTFNSAVAILLIIVVSSFSINASAQEKFITNEKEVDGLITTKTIFRNDGSLHYHLKYEYKYDEQKRMTEKASFSWDNSIRQWKPGCKYTYTYNFNTVTMDYAKWNKRENNYSLAKERNVYEMNSANIPIAFVCYKWNYKKNEWNLVNIIRYENLELLYATDK